MHTSSRPRVALYARISEDAVGDALKVSDQLKRCRKHAEDQGWEVVAEYSDNDISALTGKHRPGYEQVLDMVRRGAVDHVVVWQTSRLLRNRRERAEAIELFGKQRVGIIAIKGVSFDLSTAYGRGQAGLMGEFDTMESEVKAERVAAAAVDRAMRGRPSGSLGYGWIQHGLGRDASWKEHPHQAEVVREIVDRLLRGESLRAITEGLNERGEPSPERAAWDALDEDERQRRLANGRKEPSAAWGKTSVKKMAMRESNIAIRVHHRGKEDEARFDGCWPGIVDEGKHHRVVALLKDPSRRTNRHLAGVPGGVLRPGARQHLLSWGVALCGVCESVLGAHRRVSARYGKALTYYRCPKGCVGRQKAFLDGYVAYLVIERLKMPDATSLIASDGEESARWSERAASIRARLDEAADSYAEGRITVDQMNRITARLKPDLDEAAHKASRAMAQMAPDLVAELSGDDAEAAWEQMTVAQQYALLRALRVQVLVFPSDKRGALQNRDGTPGPGYDTAPIEVRMLGRVIKKSGVA